MIDVQSFTLEGDLFYQQKVVIPFRRGITLFTGINYDAGPTESTSNGTGKTRLPRLLSAFIYNKSERETLKKMVLPNFKASLQFANERENALYNFSYTMKENEWSITRNGGDYIHSHKSTECQDIMAKEIGLKRQEWANYVHVNRSSITILLKGEPKYRREYLENFFNIDEFYKEKYAEYQAVKAKLEEELHALHQDQARLGQVLEALGKLEDEVYLDHHTAFVNESVVTLRASLNAVQREKLTVARDVTTWHDYYQSCARVSTMPKLAETVEAMKARQTEVAVLREKNKNQEIVKQKAGRLSRFPDLVEPQAPESGDVQAEEISVLEGTLHKMQEKTRLINKFTALKATLPQVKHTLEILQAVRTGLLNDKAETELHIALVKDGKNCSRCGQSVEFVLGDKEPSDRVKELAETLAATALSIVNCNKDIEAHRQKEQILKQLTEIKAEAEALPVFGQTCEVVQASLAEKKEALKLYRTYTANLTAYRKAVQEKEILLAEATALGYPDILTEEIATKLSTAVTDLNELEVQHRILVEHETLLTKACDLTSAQTLKDTLELLLHDEKFYGEALDSLLQTKGDLGARLEQVKTFTTSRLALEAKLGKFEARQKEFEIVEALAKFFAPAGFKVYELRKRCEFLIERANFWSPLFFQEQHEWSLSSDLDDLDFLVQPVKHRERPPFSASLLSLGEENRAERVLLFSQLELTPPEKQVKLLIMDEVEGNLDQAGRLVFTEVVVPKLKETFPNKAIIIISHEESLKKSFDIDHLWIAERKDRKTTLKTIDNIHRRTTA